MLVSSVAPLGVRQEPLSGPPSRRRACWKASWAPSESPPSALANPMLSSSFAPPRLCKLPVCSQICLDSANALSASRWAPRDHSTMPMFRSSTAPSSVHSAPAATRARLASWKASAAPCWSPICHLAAPSDASSVAPASEDLSEPRRFMAPISSSSFLFSACCSALRNPALPATESIPLAPGWPAAASTDSWSPSCSIPIARRCMFASRSCQPIRSQTRAASSPASSPEASSRLACPSAAAASQPRSRLETAEPTASQPGVSSRSLWSSVDSWGKLISACSGDDRKPSTPTPASIRQASAIRSPPARSSWARRSHCSRGMTGATSQDPWPSDIAT
mmetsp:Transcript_5219/g.14194  ORF Transcript_5219/g.14194 Transcript_5219/m.14194 type:complete len:335 (+) Transcript_5219:261-1265(+)